MAEEVAIPRCELCGDPMPAGEEMFNYHGYSGPCPKPPLPRPQPMRVLDLFNTNVERCKEWHPGGITEWSALEWAGAMAGEAGEAANAAKKLKRIESKLQNINAPGRSLIDEGVARDQVAEEVADTILYGLLLMARVGISDPEAVIRDVFNRKSEQYGFPHRV